MEQIKDLNNKKIIDNDLLSTKQSELITTSKYKKSSVSNDGSKKIEKLKTRSKSIPLLISKELDGNNNNNNNNNDIKKDNDKEDNNEKNTQNVVFRSKSVHSLNEDKNNEKIKDNRLSVPVDIKLTKSIDPINNQYQQLDDFKKRSLILNTKLLKTNTTFENMTKIKTNSVSSSTATTNENETSDYEELFDPSIVFLNSYRCRYYDFNRRIRKGKLLLSANELVFKCSGMPFVKANLKYESIENIKIIDKFENINTKLLSIDYNHLNKQHKMTFYFYHFLVPMKLVKLNLKYLIKKSNKFGGSNRSKNSFIEKNTPKAVIDNNDTKKQNKILTNSESEKVEPTVAEPIPRQRHKNKSETVQEIVNSKPVSNNTQLPPSNNNTQNIKTENILNTSTPIEISTVKKTTTITIFLFLFMVFFIMINFFKLSELEREINSN